MLSNCESSNGVLGCRRMFDDDDDDDHDDYDDHNGRGYDCV